MVGRIKRFVIYCKVTFLCLLFVAVIVLVAQNWGYKTRFWPGASEKEVPTLWLILITSVLSILFFWVLTKTRRVFTELAEVRAQHAEERKKAEQQERSQALTEQERRIDEKIKKAMEDKNSQA